MLWLPYPDRGGLHGDGEYAAVEGEVNPFAADIGLRAPAELLS